MSERNEARHGGPYDRGSADSWYRRGRDPHYYVGGTLMSDIVLECDMTSDELEEYHRGYDDNEADNAHKEY